MKNDYYETKKLIEIIDSTDDFFAIGIYQVYMNKIGTMGVFDAKERFVSVLLLKNIGITWNYISGEDEHEN